MSMFSRFKQSAKQFAASAKPVIGRVTQAANRAVDRVTQAANRAAGDITSNIPGFQPGQNLSTNIRNTASSLFGTGTSASGFGARPSPQTMTRRVPSAMIIPPAPPLPDSFLTPSTSSSPSAQAPQSQSQLTDSAAEQITLFAPIRNLIPTTKEKAMYIQFFTPKGRAPLIRRITSQRYKDLMDGTRNPQTRSDQELLHLEHIGAPFRYLTQIESEVKQTENTGAWFPYFLKEEIDMDLSRYGVFKESQYDQIPAGNCFCHIFKDHPKYDMLKQRLVSKYTSQNEIKKVCDLLEVSIELTKYRGEQSQISKYGKQYHRKYSIGLIGKHFFIQERTNYPAIWIKNMLKEKQSKVLPQAARIKSFYLISLMLQNKDMFLKEITTRVFDSIYWKESRIVYDSTINTVADTKLYIGAEIKDEVVEAVEGNTKIKDEVEEEVVEENYERAVVIVPPKPVMIVEENYERAVVIVPPKPVMIEEEVVEEVDEEAVRVGEDGRRKRLMRPKPVVDGGDVKTGDNEENGGRRMRLIKPKTVKTTDKLGPIEGKHIDDAKVPYEKPPKKDWSFKNKFYADIETTTDGNHKPYLFALYPEDSDEYQWWWGDDCVDRGLRYLAYKKNPLVYFHNLGYDSKFFIDKLNGINSIETSASRTIMVSGYYYKTRIVFHDTLALVQAPLAAFAKMFGLDEAKYEDFPYNLYKTKQDVDQEHLIDHGNYSYIPEQYHIKKLKNKNLLSIVDFRQYAIDYCLRDCLVLKNGFMTFKRWIMDELKIDIDYVLTAAGLADRYIKERGCYDGTFSCSGRTRAFLQEAVVGGRTSLAMNDDYDYEVREVKEDVYDVDATSLYPSAMMNIEGFPIGIPNNISDESLATKEFMKSDLYFVQIKVTKVNKKLKLPCMSYYENHKRIWENNMEGRIVIVDKITLEDWIRFHEIEFEPIYGMEYTNGFNPTIKEVMTELFQLRKHLKSIGNPAEAVYKLIMNSGYGKSIERPHNTKTRYVLKKNGDRYLHKNYGTVEEITALERHFRMVKEISISNHYSYPQIGAYILSMSKRIMNNTTELADGEIYYTDTDSMFITKHGLDQIHMINPDLIGNNPGQFHVDFTLKGTNVRAIEGYFLAPKTYCLKLVNDEGDSEFHVRMKGIPKTSHREKVKEFGGDYLCMFHHMINNPLEFDLLAGDKVHFEFKSDLTVMNIDEFKRIIGPFTPSASAQAPQPPASE